MKWKSIGGEKPESNEYLKTAPFSLSPLAVVSLIGACAPSSVGRSSFVVAVLRSPLPSLDDAAAVGALHPLCDFADAQQQQCSTDFSWRRFVLIRATCGIKTPRKVFFLCGEKWIAAPGGGRHRWSVTASAEVPVASEAVAALQAAISTKTKSPS